MNAEIKFWSLEEEHNQVVCALDVKESLALSGCINGRFISQDIGGTSFPLAKETGKRILSLSWSPGGDYFLCVNESDAEIYNKGGEIVATIPTDTRPLVSLRESKGHIGAVTCGKWNPNPRKALEVLTCSVDGSMRVWDLDRLKSYHSCKSEKYKQHVKIFQSKWLTRDRVGMSTCVWDSEGRYIAAGLEDGTIQIWDTTKYESHAMKPHRKMEAHKKQITGLKFGNNDMFYSRSFDGTLKLWDVRDTFEHVRVWDHLPNRCAGTNVELNTDKDTVITGTSEKGRNATLNGFDVNSGNLRLKIEISAPNVVHCVCPREHGKKIFVTYGDENNGGTLVLDQKLFKLEDQEVIDPSKSKIRLSSKRSGSDVASSSSKKPHTEPPIKGADVDEPHAEGADVDEPHAEGADVDEPHAEGADVDEPHAEGADVNDDDDDDMFT